MINADWMESGLVQCISKIPSTVPEDMFDCKHPAWCKDSGRWIIKSWLDNSQEGRREEDIMEPKNERDTYAWLKTKIIQGTTLVCRPLNCLTYD
jgi:hypothetical protein